MFFIWILLLLPIVAVTLPILRMFGVVTWQWKYIFAPIWVPIAAFFAWMVWILVPIISISLFILLLTGGKPIP